MMPDGAAKAPRKAASNEADVLRAKIDERLDHLTGLWREIEKRLLKLQQPRHVYYVYHTEGRSDPNAPPDDTDCYCIGIAKYAGKWRLCLGEFNEYNMWHHDVPISWRPITDCSMEERIVVAPYVGHLEKKIVETGAGMLPS